MEAVQRGTYTAGTRPHTTLDLHHSTEEFTLVSRCLFSHWLLSFRCGLAPLSDQNALGKTSKMTSVVFILTASGPQATKIGVWSPSVPSAAAPKWPWVARFGLGYPALGLSWSYGDVSKS